MITTDAPASGSGHHCRIDEEPIPFSEEITMWRCTVCGYIYDEAKEGKKFEDLPDDWSCPVCNVPKDAFVRM